MKSRASRQFWTLFEALPKDVQDRARQAYDIFRLDPHHASLQFKRVHPSRPIYSARVTRDYRVVGVRQGEVIVWF